MGCQTEGIGLRVPGLIYLLEEELPVPTQGDGVDLSTRVNFHSHHLHAILCG